MSLVLMTHLITFSFSANAVVDDDADEEEMHVLATLAQVKDREYAVLCNFADVTAFAAFFVWGSQIDNTRLLPSCSSSVRHKFNMEQLKQREEALDSNINHKEVGQWFYNRAECWMACPFLSCPVVSCRGCE